MAGKEESWVLLLCLIHILFRKKHFKVHLTPEIRWEVVGLTLRSLQAEAEEKTNRTLDFQGPSFALE